MSEGKHTPGPWAIGEAGDLIVTGPCDEFICGDVAHVHDANLIAAAPELLEALESLLAIVEQHDTPLSDPERIAARAAIAKAKGEA